ncbi:class F sortase [Patescibacteria group bacterium]|nr:class F sortase [Patescibacteria group bacterium]
MKEAYLSTDSSVFEEAHNPIYSFPKKLMIDSLGIDVEIVSVSVDEKGQLESPKNWNEAGWYQKSAKPSEPGNLLINAHYDDRSGRPAAFWKLKNINVGDKVSVLDSYDRVYDYSVTSVFYVDINDPDRLSIFDTGPEDKSLMTLITCGGVWSYSDGTYNKRLVVSAELISD